ncbi:MAG TPA: sigma-70 family RNA polymerase sigma factor [Saprospiraceae bacterium]|nr:sigma-70 family RNA polymerase sigma factor [Saprospiraceae bacterium]
MSADWKDDWKGLIDGDREAFRRLYEKSVDELFRYAGRIIQDDALIEDGIQDLYIKLWEKRRSLPVDAPPKAYLYTSIRNNLIRVMERHYNKYTDVEVDQMHLGQEASAERDWIQGENEQIRSGSLKKALEELPDRQRELIYLKYQAGLSYDEIEEVMGITNQSLRNLMNRAMKKLRTLLGEDLFIIFCWMGTKGFLMDLLS